MKITPLDIRQKQFSQRLRGLGPREVQAFLEQLAVELEELNRENTALKDEAKRRDTRIEEYRDREKALQETLVTAQRMSEELKEAARRQAEVLLGEAELQAERIVQNAHSRRVQILAEIGEIKRQRLQLESGIRSLVDAELKLLEVFKSEPLPQVGENVEFLQKRGRSG